MQKPLERPARTGQDAMLANQLLPARLLRSQGPMSRQALRPVLAFGRSCPWVVMDKHPAATLGVLIGCVDSGAGVW